MKLTNLWEAREDHMEIEFANLGDSLLQNKLVGVSTISFMYAPIEGKVELLTDRGISELNAKKLVKLYSSRFTKLSVPTSSGAGWDNNLKNLYKLAILCPSTQNVETLKEWGLERLGRQVKSFISTSNVLQDVSTSLFLACKNFGMLSELVSLIGEVDYQKTEFINLIKGIQLMK